MLAYPQIRPREANFQRFLRADLPWHHFIQSAVGLRIVRWRHRMSEPIATNC
jgi:hypothetical protein